MVPTFKRNILPIEVVGSSETSVHFYHTTWRHIPKDTTLRSYNQENTSHSGLWPASGNPDPKSHTHP